LDSPEEVVDAAAMGIEAQSAVDALMMDNWHLSESTFPTMYAFPPICVTCEA
jgi:hypothetical protein